MPATPILDTADYATAILLGYDGPRDVNDGEGLRISYDAPTPSPWVVADLGIPTVTLNGPDGEVSLNGLAEIEAVAAVLATAIKLARADLAKTTAMKVAA